MQSDLIHLEAQHIHAHKIFEISFDLGLSASKLYQSYAKNSASPALCFTFIIALILEPTQASSQWQVIHGSQTEEWKIQNGPYPRLRPLREVLLAFVQLMAIWTLGGVNVTNITFPNQQKKKTQLYFCFFLWKGRTNINGTFKSKKKSKGETRESRDNRGGSNKLHMSHIWFSQLLLHLYIWLIFFHFKSTFT